MNTFVLGGGCYWCLDAVYRDLKGVVSVESGYAGGDSASPTYEEVSSGVTGHAEVVRVTFNESVIPADVILDIFFLIHDPTTLNRQGADVGSQYCSIMLYDNQEQQRQFEAAAQRAQSNWPNPLVTQIVLLDNFFIAEHEHQDYFNQNPEAGYCQVVVAPKVTKARANFSKWFENEEAL